ncbi:hypothetical protein QT972_24390 [Microcoleus sp. herbarium7]|uniref:hypothetical protein n=1 Tax=Microcoleus sp. herbarium7 TaxID=3055435 RepID=UPI002FD173CD
MQIVKFNSPEDAVKIQAHLYDVTIDGATLFFAKFDRAAFDFVLALEGLSSADYSANDKELDILRFSPARRAVFLELSIHNSQNTKLFRRTENERPSVFVDFPDVDGAIYQFNLLVDHNTSISINGSERRVPLNTTNPVFIEFAYLLGVAEVSSINRAACLIIFLRHERAQYYLEIDSCGQLETIRFYATDMWLRDSDI